MASTILLAALLGVLLLMMADTSVSKATGQHRIHCPLVTVKTAEAFPYKNGTHIVVVLYAVVETVGPFSNVVWKWTGPTAERQISSVVLRESPYSVGIRGFIWNARLADLGRYQITVKPRQSPYECAIDRDEKQVQISSSNKQAVFANVDVDSSLLNNDGSGVTTVWTKADGTDSPRLTVNFQQQPNDNFGRGEWTWPNADRFVGDTMLTISEDQSEYSLVVANATEADLGTYWFGAASGNRTAANLMIRTVVLKQSI